jgi:methyl-accepting chemotaxis protein
MNTVNSIYVEVEESLVNTATLLRDTIEKECNGDYKTVDGVLYAGDFDITSLDTVMTTFANDTDVYTTIFYGSERYLTTLPVSNGTSASDEVIANTYRNGENYFVKKLNINGTLYAACYVPLHDTSGNIVGMVFAGKESAGVIESINGFCFKIISLYTILMIIFAILVFLFGTKIKKKVAIVAEQVDTLASGDISTTTDVRSSIQEFYDIGEEVESLRQKLVSAVTAIRDNADNVVSTAEVISESMESCDSSTQDISSTMTELASGATSMAESVQHTAESMKNISDIANDINVKATASKGLGTDVVNGYNEADDLFKELISANQRSIDITESIIIGIKETSEAIENIQAATAIIDNIANQTNLLSLNASIEAARVGDAGKGFSVVASEIKTLAEQSRQSAGQISDVIKNINEKIAGCIDYTGQVESAMGRVSEIIEDVGNKFDANNTNISRVNESVDAISDNTSVLESHKNAVLGDVESLSAISEENAASTQEVAASIEVLSGNLNGVRSKAEELSAISEKLTDSISAFKL